MKESSREGTGHAQEPELEEPWPLLGTYVVLKSGKMARKTRKKAGKEGGKGEGERRTMF